MALRQSWAARWALGLLLALATLAVCAPLLANDQPYRIVAQPSASYQSGLRNLVAATSSIAAQLASDEPTAAGLESDRRAALHWCEHLRGLLPRARAAELDPFLRRIELSLEGLPQALASGAQPQMQLLASELGQQLLEAREQLALRAARQPLGVELEPRAHYPLLATLTRTEAAWIAAWAAFLVCLARRKALCRRGLLAMAACALAGGLLAPAQPASALTRWKLEPQSAQPASESRAVWPVLAYGYAEQHLEEAWAPPSWSARPFESSAQVRPGEFSAGSPLRHPLGTDALGRDLATRLLWGARASLAVGIAAALFSALLGTLLGAWAGWSGGLVDRLVSRLIELVQSFPTFFLVLIAVGMADPERFDPLLGIVVVIVLVRWTATARLVRADVLRQKSLDYVLAARALGAGPWRIASTHLLPNALAPVLVAGAFDVSAAMLTEAGLSFLGFGIRQPSPSWGALLNESQSPEHWWLILFPGLCVFACVACFNLLAEALREAFDPHGARLP